MPMGVIPTTQHLWVKAALKTIQAGNFFIKWGFWEVAVAIFSFGYSAFNNVISPMPQGWHSRHRSRRGRSPLPPTWSRAQPSGHGVTRVWESNPILVYEPLGLFPNCTYLEPILFNIPKTLRNEPKDYCPGLRLEVLSFWLGKRDDINLEDRHFFYLFVYETQKL